MKQYRKYLLIIPVVLAVIFGFQKLHTRSLEQERAKVEVAVEATQHALKVAQAHQHRAADAEERADNIAAARRQRAPARAAVVEAAPDTCAPAIAALEADAREADAEIIDLRIALDEQKRGTAVLTPAAIALTDAAANLADASGGSFLQDLIPDVGIGVTAGISPITRRADVIIGPTLSWDF
jgi:hypothetical protein